MKPKDFLENKIKQIIIAKGGENECLVFAKSNTDRKLIIAADIVLVKAVLREKIRFTTSDERTMTCSDFGIADLSMIAKKLEEMFFVNPKTYSWIASSDDGAYDVECDECFSTKEECYDDMRRAVLDKMCWNTNYEDFEVSKENIECAPIGVDYSNETIGYRVLFEPTKIVHESYSGTYTYQMIEL